MNKKEVYKRYLEALRVDLVKKYDELGLRASGKYSRELGAEVKGNRLIMWGSYHSIFMERGRRAGKFPPRGVIERWIEQKRGLPSEFREKKKQFAFLIARKIAKEGIKVPNTHNAGKVISSVVDDFMGDKVYKMLEELGHGYVNEVRSDIIGILKGI